MAHLQELQATLVRRTALEEELAELVPQLRPLERDIQRLKVEFNNKQLDADNLSKPGLRALVLGWTGKKEDAVTKAVREVRTVREQLSTTEFLLETLRHRSEAIVHELDATADAEALFLQQWEQQTGMRNIEAQALLQRLEQGATLLAQLPEEISELKALLAIVERYFVTGDIQTDLTGHRYDNKFRTMKAHCPPCQEALTALLVTLDQYAALFKAELQGVVPGPWTEHADYLTAQSFDAKDLSNRVDKVSCWISQVEFALKAQKARTEAELLAQRQFLRACLLALPVER